MLTHHAQLIIGSYDDVIPELEKQLEKQGVKSSGNPDFWKSHFDSFGIDDARKLSNLQLRKSFSGEKKIFILGWRQATIEAQNALLKVFEEPTQGVHFFVITQQEQLLLPTLRSRLTKLVVDIENTKSTKEARDFLKSGSADRIKQVQTIITDGDKVHALQLLNDLEVVCANSKAGMQKDIGELLISARRNLATRSPSLKLILEHLALAIPTP